MCIRDSVAVVVVVVVVVEVVVVAVVVVVELVVVVVVLAVVVLPTATGAWLVSMMLVEVSEELRKRAVMLLTVLVSLRCSSVVAVCSVDGVGAAVMGTRDRFGVNVVFAVVVVMVILSVEEPRSPKSSPKMSYSGLAVLVVSQGGMTSREGAGMAWER